MGKTLEESFVAYKQLFDDANVGKELEEIVDVNELLKTPAAPSLDTGLAFNGSVIYLTNMMWYFAEKIMSFYGAVCRNVNPTSLKKVIVLHQLGKVGMFVPNTDDWQVKKLGKVYAFAETGVCLKTGERSKMVCSNAGVVFTPEEYEAMTILDKTAEEYENMTKFRTHLSTIIRMSSDLAYAAARERAKNTNNE